MCPHILIKSSPLILKVTLIPDSYGDFTKKTDDLKKFLCEPGNASRTIIRNSYSAWNLIFTRIVENHIKMKVISHDTIRT